MRELTYYVACSLDGFIAHRDGSHDGFSQDSEYLTEVFTSFPETVPSHLRDVMGVHAENKWFDVVLMGRKTYEIGLQEGVLSPYSHLKQYLFSRSMHASPHTDVVLVSEDIADTVRQLKQEEGKGIWLCGGGVLATALLSEKLIDKLILKVNPFLMGDGIPLFSGVINQTALQLIDREIYNNGVLMLHYQVG
ncbi:dihydrofolate reductase family protein [Leptothoe sp. ISB3NOV94-8A]|nr:dihydrofolate reductase family protein [Leptothoe sp. LEGE 181152]